MGRAGGAPVVSVSSTSLERRTCLLADRPKNKKQNIRTEISKEKEQHGARHPFWNDLYGVYAVCRSRGSYDRRSPQMLLPRGGDHVLCGSVPCHGTHQVQVQGRGLWHASRMR